MKQGCRGAKACDPTSLSKTTEDQVSDTQRRWASRQLFKSGVRATKLEAECAERAHIERTLKRPDEAEALTFKQLLDEW